MDRRSRNVTATRPPVRVKQRRKNNGHAVQFLLLVSAGVLLLGSVVAWKVYSDRNGWREWSSSMRSGMFGMHESRDGEGSGKDVGEVLEGKSIRYHGDGYADLGDFSVGRYNSITNTTLIVQFQLKGMTPCRDEASFNKFMQQNERAFHDRVSQAVRDCRPSDYGDTKSMGKKVAARVNRSFSGRFLESAELADLEVYESVGNYQAEAWEGTEGGM